MTREEIVAAFKSISHSLKKISRLSPEELEEQYGDDDNYEVYGEDACIPRLTPIRVGKEVVRFLLADNSKKNVDATYYVFNLKDSTEVLEIINEFSSKVEAIPYDKILNIELFTYGDLIFKIKITTTSEDFEIDIYSSLY